MLRNSLWTVIAAAVALSAAGAVQADVVPGDVITAANKEKVRGLIPDEIYPFMVEDFADLKMTIVPTELRRRHCNRREQF